MTAVPLSVAGNGYRPLIANRLSKLSAQNKIGSRSPTSLLMQEMGLEPTRYCYHRHLKPARLPIPPLLRTSIILPKSLEECKHKFKNYTKCTKNYKSVTTPALIYLNQCINLLLFCGPAGAESYYSAILLSSHLFKIVFLGKCLLLLIR